MGMQVIDKASAMDRKEALASHDEGILKPIRTKKNDENPMFDDDQELLSPLSRIFHEPNNNIHILAIIGWKTPNGPNLGLIKETMSNTVLKRPQFSSVQVLDEKDGQNVRWVPSQVNLDNHIIVKELELKMDLSKDKMIDEYMSNLSRTPMDKSKPLWELHILMFKSPNASSKPFLPDGISIFRIHHSLGDGASLVSILLSCTRKISDPDSSPTLHIPNTRKLSTSSETLNHEGLFLFKLWYYLIRLWLKIKVISNLVVDILFFIATALLFVKDTETPIKNSKINKNKDPAYIRFTLRTVNLDDIKLIKNATNATVNDVVVGVLQAALSRYLNRRYGEEDKVPRTTGNNTNYNMIPRKIRCRATFFINLRPLLGTDATDEGNQKNKGRVEGNCFGFVLLPLKIGMVDNPLDHVRNAKAAMDRKKQTSEVIWTSRILDLLLKLFGYKAPATTLTERISLQTTFAFSNVMGPTEEISFCGHPMTFLAATCYGQPLPMMIHVVSYANKLTFALSVDDRTIPDPYEFGQDFVESLETMKKAIVATKSH